MSGEGIPAAGLPEATYGGSYDGLCTFVGFYPVLGYAWTEDPSNPATGLLSDPAAAAPSFTPTVEGTYRFTLVANDGQVETAPDEVVATVVATPFPGQVGETITAELPGGGTMAFVWIEPGTFVMGAPHADDWAGDDERPQHEVTISRGFYFGKYEVRQRQWEAVMGTSPWSGRDNAQSNPDHPAVYISWEDLQGFIQRLNDAAGEEIHRLPTEAEWEYACRAGRLTRWSFGDDEGRLGEYAWYTGLQYGQPVGTKLPNPWGLYDMHGNVREWCQDWRGSPYTSDSQVDPTGPAAGTERIVRGGEFRFDVREVRSADRGGGYSPSSRYGSLGARVLRTE